MKAMSAMSATVLGKIVIFVMAAYFITGQMHSSTSSHAVQFILASLFGGFGIVIAATIVFGLLSGKDYGTYKLKKELVVAFTVTFVCFAVFGQLLWFGCMVSVPGTTDGSQMVDGFRFADMYGTLLAGLVLGFFGLVGIHGNNRWTGE